MNFQNLFLILFILIAPQLIAAEPRYKLSFIELMFNSQKYDDKNVIVFGYYHSLGGNLYLTKDHAEHMDKTLSFFVGVNSQEEENILAKCAGSYTVVEGKFKVTKEEGFPFIYQVTSAECKQ